MEGGHLAHRHGGNWDSPRLDFFLTGSDVTSDAGRAELADFLVALRSTLAELNPPPSVRYLQHLTDEPTDTNATSYKALAEQVRTHMPGVRIFEATMSLALVGAVDVWCPQVQEYQRNRAFFDARRQAGDGVWIYTCLIPGGPWLNRLLDQERLRPVLLGWSLEASDLDGFLHWGLNHYRPGVDPFEQSVVPHGDGPPNFLPAGDSHVLYPGPDGPLSGQRFEAHRIGLEDAALLRMLKMHHPQRAAELVQAVFRGFDDYERDVTAYRATRRHLLTALDSKEPADTGVLLFNGRDLAGWTAYFPDGTKMEDVWRVEDGILICKGQPAGYLRTKEQFTNFRLTLQWRWNPATQQAGNSGVLLRVIGEEKVWPRCVEAQLQHGNAGDFWNIGDFPMQTEPDRTQGRNTRKLVAAERPVGEWNEYDILVDGGRIALRINGQLVNEASDVLEVPGWIGLQSEGTEIHFREIRIQR
ncbi:MAG: DUF1080 domain-containing protein [Phycisphaerales bacterium]|nr:DUF1080 domain-containing protein [Phycisphaerales bacterium]